MWSYTITVPECWCFTAFKESHHLKVLIHLSKPDSHYLPFSENLPDCVKICTLFPERQQHYEFPKVLHLECHPHCSFQLPKSFRIYSWSLTSSMKTFLTILATITLIHCSFTTSWKSLYFFLYVIAFPNKS